MLATLLGILKIIFLIVLLLILIIIVLISVILFVPIKYKLQGSKHDELKVTANFSWLFGIIRGKFVKNNDLSDFKLKIFFKNINNEDKEDKNIKKGNKKKKKEKKELVNKNLIEYEEINNKLEDENSIGDYKNSSINKKQKLKKKKTKKKSKGKRIDNKKNELLDNLKNIFNKENNLIIRYIIKQVKKLLMAILPKNIKIDLTFGTGDPAITGYLLGILSISYAALGDKIIISPNFEDKELTGDFYVEGRIFLVIVAYYVLKLIINKKVRKLIANFN